MKIKLIGETNMRTILAVGAVWMLCAQASAQDFQGFHVAAGGAAVRSHIAQQGPPPKGGGARADIEDIAPTVRLGYDHQFGNAVVGASWWTALGDIDDGRADNEPGGEIELQGWEVRAGYALGPWLPFVGVGEMARTGTLRYLSFNCPDCPQPSRSRIDNTATAYRVGVERHISDAAYVSASYLWADFDPEPIFDATVEGDVQAAMIEVGWRF